MNQINKIVQNIIQRAGFILLASTLSFVLSLPYFWRESTYEDFSVYFFENNSQIIDLPGGAEYLAIRAEEDSLIGGADIKLFSDASDYSNTTSGFDFGIWNKTHKQIATVENREYDFEIAREATMRRQDGDSARLSYNIEGSKLSGELVNIEKYRIILTSATGFQDIGFNAESKDIQSIDFSTGSCRMTLSDNSKDTEADPVVFTIDPNFPKSILIETDYEQNIDIELELEVDCS